MCIYATTTPLFIPYFSNCTFHLFVSTNLCNVTNGKVPKFNRRNGIVKNKKWKNETCDEENAIENSKLEIRATANTQQQQRRVMATQQGTGHTGRPDCGHDDDDDDDYDNYDDYDHDHDDYDEDEDDYDDYDEDHDDDDHDDDDHDDDDHNDDNSSKRHCRLPFVAFTIIADVDTNDINHSAINMSDTEIAHERIPGGVALHLRPPTL